MFSTFTSLAEIHRYGNTNAKELRRIAVKEMRNPRSNAWKALNTDGILDAIILDIPKEDAKYKVKDVESYLQYMSNDSIWGDHIVLQTLTDIFNVYVEIINTHLSHAYTMENTINL